MSSTTEHDGISDKTGTDRYAPGSAEDKLLKLDADASKKALHDSRTLKRLGTLFIVLGFLEILLVLFFCFFPRFPGIPDEVIRDFRLKALFLSPLIVIFPAFGITLRHCRSTAAKWLFRVVSILTVVSCATSMILQVRASNIPAFIGDLVAVLVSLRLCVITYNELLFGPNAPSHHQIGYVRSKWKSGQRPEHIPEHVHKPPKYTVACFVVSFLMIPAAMLQVLDDVSNMMNQSKAQEYFENGKALIAEAGRPEHAKDAADKYTKAYFFFTMAASDKTNKDVHVYLGICYARGLGCKQSDFEAFHHLNMFPTVTNEYPDAQYELGLLYLHGWGTNQDVAQAAKLFQAAAAKGQPYAREILGYPKIDTDSPVAVDDAPDYRGLTVEEYLIRKIGAEADSDSGTER